ncbi:unnamed protein product [Prunus armeniaca]|uniref:Uncharacterized protein n=1 Tax=Prunus armeniaca TaxID=36596 RepID=A0A6J5XXI4_PRUAR|nr:unnamed protein product [Prunus armeniaca]
MQHNGVLNIQELNCSVDRFFRNGWWNVDQLRNALTEDLVQKITAIPIGFGNSVHDAQIWGLMENENPSQNSYLHLAGLSRDYPKAMTV